MLVRIVKNWDFPDLLRQTLAEAAQIGRCVAFAGDMILGHEMHLDATVQALADNDLTFVYFCESRHQKGDWFVAKRRAPHLVLAHHFTPQQMVPLDYHAACHNWVHFARERGVRFCYVNFFRVLHATAPLEGLDYVHHLKHALEDAGFELAADATPPVPIPTPQPQELALTGLAAAGVGATAVSNLLNLPPQAAVQLTTAAAAGAWALPHLEQRRNAAAVARYHHAQSHTHRHDHATHDHHHHHHAHDHDHDHGDLHALYPPSYAPKLLALAAAALGPIPLTTARNESEWLTGVAQQTAAALTLAAVTSGQEVRAGDTIGFVGNTGNARTTPPHLHFGVYLRREGPVDPYPFVDPPRGRLEALTADVERLGTWVRLRNEGLKSTVLVSA